MAVVTYTLGIDAATGKATISPDVKAVEFRPGDFIVFQRAAGDETTVVQVQMPLDAPQFLGCVAAGRLVIRNPEVDTDGNVVVAFEQKAGDGVGDPPPFPGSSGTGT